MGYPQQNPHLKTQGTLWNRRWKKSKGEKRWRVSGKQSSLNEKDQPTWTYRDADRNHMPCMAKH